jgi:hypothetical protein
LVPVLLVAWAVPLLLVLLVVLSAELWVLLLVQLCRRLLLPSRKNYKKARRTLTVPGTGPCSKPKSPVPFPDWGGPSFQPGSSPGR